MIAKNLLNSLKIRNRLQLQPISRSACATGKYYSLCSCVTLDFSGHHFCIVLLDVTVFLLNILLVCSPYIFHPYGNTILTNVI